MTSPRALIPHCYSPRPPPPRSGPLPQACSFAVAPKTEWRVFVQVAANKGLNTLLFCESVEVFGMIHHPPLRYVKKNGGKTTKHLLLFNSESNRIKEQDESVSVLLKRQHRLLLALESVTKISNTMSLNPAGQNKQM